MEYNQFQSGLDCNVLVLNKNYMAVRIVRAKRAFSLLCRQLAEVISIEDNGAYANYDFESWCDVSRFKRNFEPEGLDWVKTVNFDLAVPRIIRLLFYDKIPIRKLQFNRKNLFARDKNICQYCGHKFATSELSLDHVIPKSRGGKANWQNIVCSCVRCNSKKGGRTPKEAGMHLVRKPVRPKKNPHIHLHLGNKRYSSWKQFLDHAYWTVELH